MNYLQLEEFFINKIHIDYHQKKENTSKVNLSLKIGIDVKPGLKKEKRDIVKISIKITPEPKESYEIDSEITGFFSRIKGIPEKDREEILRKNGFAILYGIMRGQLALITGTFPEGKLNLPTVPVPYSSKKKS